MKQTARTTWKKRNISSVQQIYYRLNRRNLSVWRKLGALLIQLPYFLMSRVHWFFVLTNCIPRSLVSKWSRLSWTATPITTFWFKIATLWLTCQLETQTNIRWCPKSFNKFMSIDKWKIQKTTIRNKKLAHAAAQSRIVSLRNKCQIKCDSLKKFHIGCDI